MVFVRLLVPISFETRFSFMPSEQQRDVFVAEMLEIVSSENASGVQVQDFVGAVAGEADEDIPYTDGNLSEGKPTIGIIGENIENENIGAGNLYANVVGTENMNFRMNSDTNSVVQEVKDSVLTTDSMKMPRNGFLPGAIFFILWAMGFVIVLGINIWAMVRMRRLLGKPAEYRKVMVVNSFTRREKSVPVYLCENSGTPFTLGFLNPAIYLPGKLADEELEYILCHEQVHISRMDNMVKHVTFLLTAIYWFNPLVWVAFFFMERDMEMSCDEKVLKIMGRDIKRDYCQSLLSFAEGRDKIPATHLNFGENSVKQRVKNVLSYKKAKKWSVAIGGVVLIVVVVALFTTGREELPAGGEAQGAIEQEQVEAQGSVIQEEDNPDAQIGESATYYNTPELALEARIAEYMKENKLVTWGKYNYFAKGDTTTIQYTVTDSLNKYILEETVSVLAKDDTYSVEPVSMVSYEQIDSKEQFDALYWDETSKRYWWNTVDYNLSYYRRILQLLLYGGDAAESEYAKRFTDPVTAAVELLNLGAGEGKILEAPSVDSVPEGMYATQNPIGNAVAVHFYVAEGRKVTVSYTFNKDGSQIEIPMVLCEGTTGIWGLEGAFVRTVYATRNITTNADGSEGDVIELTSHGLYRRNQNGLLTCIYPYYVNTENGFTVKDGVVYFVVDSGYWEESLEYEEDAICMLDLNTGEIDKTSLQLGELNRVTAPIKDINVFDGFVQVTCNGKDYKIPLVNTGQAGVALEHTYNGKAITDLTKGEQDAYGVALRQQLLRNPGQVLKLSNRTLEETYVLIDLDGDDKTEKASMKIQTISHSDHYQFRIGDSVLEDRGDCISNEIWAFSLDGKEILLAIYDDGPSGDPQTMLFAYRNGEVKMVGEFYQHIEDVRIEKDIIHAKQGAYPIQTDRIYCQYVMSTDGILTFVEQETYDFTGLNDIKLLVELPVHSAPGSEDVIYIKPQMVHFTKTDKTQKWVYVEGEDGTGGWMLVGTFGWVNELKKDSREVFEGLNMAG